MSDSTVERVRRAALVESGDDRLPDSQAGIVAVIPAYNEERFIGSVVLTARQFAQAVIVVDDGSADDTALIAQLSGAEVIRLPENRGKGAALNEGFARASILRPAAVVMLDGDAQHDASEIPLVASPVVRGEADIVIGSRFLGTRSAIPGWRRAGQHALTVITNTASGLTTSDSQSGYRAFSPRALEKLQFRSRGLAMESEMQFLARKAGLRVAEVPISVQYLDPSKRNPFLHGMQVIDSILTLVARRRPLLFLGVPGVLLMIAGLLAGLDVIQIIDTRHKVPFGTATLSALLVLAGLLLFIAAIILNTLEHFMKRLEEQLLAVVGPRGAVHHPPRADRAD